MQDSHISISLHGPNTGSFSRYCWAIQGNEGGLKKKGKVHVWPPALLNRSHAETVMAQLLHSVEQLDNHFPLWAKPSMCIKYLCSLARGTLIFESHQDV